MTAGNNIIQLLGRPECPSLSLMIPLLLLTCRAVTPLNSDQNNNSSLISSASSLNGSADEWNFVSEIINRNSENASTAFIQSLDESKQISLKDNGGRTKDFGKHQSADAFSKFQVTGRHDEGNRAFSEHHRERPKRKGTRHSREYNFKPKYFEWLPFRRFGQYRSFRGPRVLFFPRPKIIDKDSALKIYQRKSNDLYSSDRLSNGSKPVENPSKNRYLDETANKLQSHPKEGRSLRSPTTIFSNDKKDTIDEERRQSLLSPLLTADHLPERGILSSSLEEHSSKSQLPSIASELPRKRYKERQVRYTKGGHMLAKKQHLEKTTQLLKIPEKKAAEVSSTGPPSTNSQVPVALSVTSSNLARASSPRHEARYATKHYSKYAEKHAQNLPVELLPIFPGGGSRFDDWEREKLERNKLAQKKDSGEESGERDAEGLKSSAGGLEIFLWGIYIRQSRSSDNEFSINGEGECTNVDETHVGEKCFLQRKSVNSQTQDSNLSCTRGGCLSLWEREPFTGAENSKCFASTIEMDAFVGSFNSLLGEICDCFQRLRTLSLSSLYCILVLYLHFR